MDDHAVPTEPAPVTRRRWIDVLLGSSFVAWGGAVVYPVLRYLTPQRDAGARGRCRSRTRRSRSSRATGS